MTSLVIRHRLASLCLAFCTLASPSLPADAASPDAASPIEKSSPEKLAFMPGDAIIPGDAVKFLQNQCIDCHDGPGGEGGFDVQTVDSNLTDPATMDRWIRIHDRVERGEMPPPEDAELDPATAKEFLDRTAASLARYQSEQHRLHGRVQGRRLSNLHLSRTLQDLLRVDVPLEQWMPPEQRVGGYSHLASAQSMSHFHLQNHLRVVDAALDAAFDQALANRRDWSIDLPPEKIANKRPGRRNREPEMRDGLAVVWSAGLIFYGRITSTTVPRDGWYDIELTASSVKPPKEHGVWCSVRSGDCSSGSPLMSWIGGFEAESEPKTMTFRAWITQGHRLEVRPADVTLKRGKFQGGQVGFGEGEDQDVPGVAIHSLKMKAVSPGGDRKTVRERLFGDLPMRFNNQIKRTEVNVEKLSAKRQHKSLHAAISRFADLAFRRPAEPGLLDAIHQLASDALDDGQSFDEALRAGYRAVLCSPRFLYLTEPCDEEGRLDDWAVASRLSYFLTGSMPDDELRRVADANELRSPEMLERQTDRLLQTRRGQRFLIDFADQWLDLVDIDFTEPDRRLFGNFDTTVQDAMLQETHLFLQKLLDENRPVDELVNANYTFLNSRLARYYDLPEAHQLADQLDDQMQLVRFDASSPRGGLLAHGSILKVTANGNDTSPVLRGIWVSERILGVEIPAPPANIPAVEPDIRGATTIRELLAKHQADSSCAACHQNIDPPGFALENFDAGGRWRDRYMQLDGKRYKRGAKVDASFEMPDGSTFDSFVAFRDLIGERSQQLATNVVSHWLTYGTGQTVQFADRGAIAQMIRETRDSDHGFRSLLDQTIQSPLFLSK